MSFRFPLAAMTLSALCAFAVPALAMEQIHLPDPSAAGNSGPPDALFDKSVPTTWQKNSDEKQSGAPMSQFHFSVGGSNGYGQSQSSSSFGEDAKKPGSEFIQNQPAYGYPFSQQQ